MKRDKRQQRPDKARDLRRMKAAATGLLIAMIALFAVSAFFERAYPVLGFVRAFAEAGMAGGIADWFAVTALFRHPLRLPLPHTAIIPRNKDRIGENLGNFFEQNFLSQEDIAAKLADVDLSGAFVRWIGKPEQTGQIADYLAGLMPDLLASVGTEDVEQFTRSALAARIREIELAPLVGGVLTQVAQTIDYDALITPALEELALLFHENHDLIRRRVREGTGWIWQRIALDDKVADAVIRVIDEAMTDVRDNRDHPWRRRFGEFAHELIAGLAASPAYLAKCEAWREQLLEHPAFATWVGSLWSELVEQTRMDAQAPDSVVKARLQTLITQWTREALRDEALRSRMNERAREAILDMMPAQRHELARLIADTVRRWDTATVTEKLEVEVGRDLQFVRVNGTLIGGMVGLVLHALGTLF
ncbi:DUF445 domain-containing protein [Trinickia sp. EG282A]|uniref:DUF445 domain-containing protein n=1 Tax=Trinickia sp. EG282A TaxID=3237013 RepID=UPI0034D22583